MFRKAVQKICVLIVFCLYSVVYAEPPTEQQSVPSGLSALDMRISSEIDAADNPYAIAPHRPNYILPLAYDSSPTNKELDNVEIKFQTSFRVPIWTEILGEKSHLFFAYKNKSLWQAYNSDISAPFRETNHEAELFLVFLTHYRFFNLNNRVAGIGFSHESNGQSGLLSRSWNRLYANFLFEQENNYYVGLKAWYRIPESKKEDPLDPKGDDNPSIERYLGNFELTVLKRLKKHSFSVKLHNNLRADNKGSIQLDYTYPIGGPFRGYVQIFNGYGESLIDYNHSTQRIGFGILLGDWFQANP